MSIDDLIRDHLRSLVEPVDEAAVTASIEARPRTGNVRARRPVLGIAAVVVLVLIAFTAIATRGDGTRNVRSGPGTAPNTTIRSHPVAFDLLWSGWAAQPAGALAAATDALQLDALRAAGRDLGVRVDPFPQVDLDRQVVVSITIRDDGCEHKLDRIDAREGTLTPAFIKDPEAWCNLPESTKTYVLALDWADVGSAFRLHLPADAGSGFVERLLDVRKPTTPPTSPPGEAASDPTTTPPGSTEVSVPATPDPAPPPTPAPSTPQPLTPAHLTGRIEVPSSSVPSGGSLPAVVVVNNGTGTPVQIGYCISPFSIGLRGTGVWMAMAKPDCLQLGVLPVGESRWTTTILTSSVSCSADPPPPAGAPEPCPADHSTVVPPGIYTTQVEGPLGPTFDFPPVTVTVTPSG